MSTAEQYANDVLSGKILAGELIKLSAKRFLNDLKRDDIYFDELEANRLINFAENHCLLWEDRWRGVPVQMKPWMCFVLQQVYGWFRKDSGSRRIRKTFVEVAKKNAKSTLVGIVANYHLFADQRIQTPSIYVGANNEDQAKICVNITGKIIENSPDLYEYVIDGTVDIFNYKEKIVNVVHRDRDGFIKALPKESNNKTDKTAGGKHGINCSLGIIDEYAMADSDGVLSALESSQAARAEPLIFCITTAGFKQNGPCYQQLRRVGIEILEGRMEDDSYLPFIYEHDKGDDIYDEKIWIKSNPNLGVSVYPDFLKGQLTKAKNEGGSTEVDVKTLNFNMWCEAAEVWIPGEVWDVNSYGTDKEELIGAACFGGLDLASGLDLNAFSLIFPDLFNIDGKNISPILVWFWMPEAKVQLNREKIDYRQWVDAGLIKTTPGNIIDHEFLTEDIKEIATRYQLHSIAYDPFIAHHGVVQNLLKEGIEMNQIGQGFRQISEPTKEWERRLTNRTIEHFNNPVLGWMNKNTTIIRDANRNIKIMKIDGEKGSLKIDGIAACINALAQSMSFEQKVNAIDIW